MTRGIRFNAAMAAALAIVVAYAAVLMADLPGFLTVDSVMTLHEGHFHRRESWNPAFHAWLLGRLDALWPGTALHVVLTGGLLFGAWLWLSRIAGRVSWLATVLIVAAALTPNVLIYQGIVWKDVLFADLGVFGFVALAAAAKGLEAGRRPWVALGASIVALSAAALVRQNGLVLWLPALAALAWAARGGGWRRAAGFAAGWGACAGVLTLLLSVLCLPQGPGFEVSASKGVRILQLYDLAAAVSDDPSFPLPASERANPRAVATLRANAGRYWSPQRVDFLNAMPKTDGKLFPVSDADLRSDWLGLVTHRPGLYLANRLEVFRWVFATPQIDRCLPVTMGTDGIAWQMKELGIPQRWDARDTWLYDYAMPWVHTPVMSHITYAVLSLLLIGVLLIRRRPADVPIAALQVGALGFAASFFVLSLACDYRYLYVLDLAALTGLIHVAMDPRLRRTG